MYKIQTTTVIYLIDPNMVYPIFATFLYFLPKNKSIKLVKININSEDSNTTKNNLNDNCNKISNISV